MNPFILAMERSGELSAAALKRLFRLASKKAHPDLSGSGGEAFLKIKADYEEALAFLARGSAARGPDRGQALTPREARRRLLEGLRAFTVKVFTGRADAILDAMVADAAAYEPGVAALLARYRDGLYALRAQWANDANLYYAHSVFISGARQLFLFYDQGSWLHRTLVLRYRESMDKWTRKLPAATTELLSRLYAWIESELDGEPVSGGA